MRGVSRLAACARARRSATQISVCARPDTRPRSETFLSPGLDLRPQDRRDALGFRWRQRALDRLAERRRDRVRRRAQERLPVPRQEHRLARQPDDRLEPDGLEAGGLGGPEEVVLVEVEHRPEAAARLLGALDLVDDARDKVVDLRDVEAAERPPPLGVRRSG